MTLAFLLLTLKALRPAFELDIIRLEKRQLSLKKRLLSEMTLKSLLATVIILETNGICKRILAGIA